MDLTTIEYHISQLEKERKSIKAKLKKLPKTHFYLCHQGDYSKWYQIKDSEHIYIPKSNRKLAEELATRKYLELHLRDIDDEIDAYTSLYETLSSLRAQPLIEDSAYKELIQYDTFPNNKTIRTWLAEPYTSNPYHPENLTHKSESGNILRSKSEGTIDFLLYQMSIPFKYECPLEMNGLIYYPDFTIMRPRDRRLIYWEHFGMMDDPDYAQKTYQKMQTYIDNGYIPGDNLICTFETLDHPLTPDTVQKIINTHIL